MAKAKAGMAKSRAGNGLLENVKTIIYAGLIAIGIRTVAFEPFNIPSTSMEPTLLVGDYLFVSKYSYGYSRFSMPFAPDIFSGRLFGRLPERGDVVVFKVPYDTTIDYIKRVIGLPGDKIATRGGELFINGVQVPRVRGDVSISTDSGIPTQGRLYTETLPNGRRHEIKKLTDEGEANNYPEITVPPGQLFVMGDNRDNSADSRFRNPPGVGLLPVENVVGRAEFLFFSIDATHPWWEVWEWPFEIRWSRLLNGIR